MSNTKPTPALLAGSALKRDPLKRRGRAYGLGERNPDTLPGSGNNAESVDQNHTQTRRLRSIRKWVQSANSAGFKY